MCSGPCGSSCCQHSEIMTGRCVRVLLLMKLVKVVMRMGMMVKERH